MSSTLSWAAMTAATAACERVTIVCKNKEVLLPGFGREALVVWIGLVQFWSWSWGWVWVDG